MVIFRIQINCNCDEFLKERFFKFHKRQGSLLIKPKIYVVTSGKSNIIDYMFSKNYFLDM